jgi:hypothetical protein
MMIAIFSSYKNSLSSDIARLRREDAHSHLKSHTYIRKLGHCNVKIRHAYLNGGLDPSRMATQWDGWDT